MDRRFSRCCFTGHRPEKLQADEMTIKKALQKEISNTVADGITVFISGMARGVDLWAAQLILNLKEEVPNVKLIGAVPYMGFEEK